MSTIDMTQVAGLQAVNAEGKVIGTLSVDDLTELVSAKIIQEAKNETVSARSASVMSEASTLAATDEYEDKLDIDTNPAYIRSLDSEGNPKRTATTSLASVVGGLLVNQGFQSKVGGLTYIGVIDSFDERLEQGLYWCKGGAETTGDVFTEKTSGAPIGIYRWGNLLVFKGFQNSITQIYLPVSYGYTYAKICWRTSPETDERNLGKWSIIDGTIV